MLLYPFCVGAFSENSARNHAVKHYNKRFAHSTFNLLVLLLIAGANGILDTTFWVQQDCCWYFVCCRINFVLARSLEILPTTMLSSTTTRGLLTQQSINLTRFWLLVQALHLMLHFGHKMPTILIAVVLILCGHDLCSQPCCQALQQGVCSLNNQSTCLASDC